MGRRLTPTTPGPATDYRIGDFVLRLPAGHRLPEFQAAHRLYDRLPLSLSTLTLHGWIVDIGANVGDTAAALASGQAKSLVCIEPDPAFFVRLKQNTETIKAAGSTIICIEAAVGPAGEKVSLNRTDTTAFVSASEDGGMNLRTLDSILVEAIGDANVALIKCDVDGFDAAALLSGVDVLRRDQPLLLVECEVRNEQQAKTWRTALAELEVLGYDKFAIFDNFGLPLHPNADRQVLQDCLDYTLNLNRGLSARTVYYFDILATGPRSAPQFAQALDHFSRTWLG